MKLIKCLLISLFLFTSQANASAPDAYFIYDKSGQQLPVITYSGRNQQANAMLLVPSHVEPVDAFYGWVVALLSGENYRLVQGESEVELEKFSFEALDLLLEKADTRDPSKLFYELKQKFEYENSLFQVMRFKDDDLTQPYELCFITRRGCEAVKELLINKNEKGELVFTIVNGSDLGAVPNVFSVVFAINSYFLALKKQCEMVHVKASKRVDMIVTCPALDDGDSTKHALPAS